MVFPIAYSIQKAVSFIQGSLFDDHEFSQNTCLPHYALYTHSKSPLHHGDAMKLSSHLTLALLITHFCQAREMPAYVQEIVPEIEIEIIDNCPQQNNPKPQIIIQGVANILANVGAIVSAPRNKQKVSNGVTGILANIINIALVSGKRDHRSGIELFNIICDELNLDEPTREIVKQKIEEINQENNTLQL
jgi:hypothetical protein